MNAKGATPKKPARVHNPHAPTTLETLLQGHPGEYVEIPHGDQVESDRHHMTTVARRWATNPHLTDEERERIRVVWLDSQEPHDHEGTPCAVIHSSFYRQPLNVDRARREALRALILPRSRTGPEARPTTEQLQAALSGKGEE
jgi:hypothetical protein